ncbi:MAG TPA: alpha/beta fold hydrolase [Candidatus Saccharimonadales bacterium]|nr:alpha/beta fold hydrolase [Candidatus Saccharimonadales bacterium]
MILGKLKKISLKKWLLFSGIGLVTLFVLFMFAGIWGASGQILSPQFLGLKKDLAFCPTDAQVIWGENCGNLRQTKQFAFSEVNIVTGDYSLPGWLIKTNDNSKGQAKGAILLVHSGGSDRREDTKHIGFFLNQGLDVLTFDMSCHGEAPCPGQGLTYGYRESQDIAAAYNLLAENHEKVYVMGSSMGATSVLAALPQLDNVSGVIAENPMFSFERLISEAPEAKSMPKWFSQMLINLVKLRGGFDDSRTPITGLSSRSDVPILFMHSKQDKIVNYTQTQELANTYQGPKTIWITETGNHSELWNADQKAFENTLENFIKL